MAHFQKVSGDKTTRFDSNGGKLVLMLGEKPRLDLWGGGPSGEELLVDFSNPAVAKATAVTKTGSNWLRTYELQALKPGSAVLEARLLNQTSSDGAHRTIWPQLPVWAKVQVEVRGNDYRQGDARWGNLVYGSTRPEWKNVQWTPMDTAGCGPTALATMMDYVLRLANPAGKAPASFFEPGADPMGAMNYASSNGRAVKVSGEKDQEVIKKKVVVGDLIPNGTNAHEMIANIGNRWPGYAGHQVMGIDQAAAYIKHGHPLLILCQKCTTYTYDSSGTKKEESWKNGHYLAVVGVEHDGQTFWLSDPSRSAHRFISREELKKATIWVVYKTANSCQM